MAFEPDFSNVQHSAPDKIGQLREYVEEMVAEIEKGCDAEPDQVARALLVEAVVRLMEGSDEGYARWCVERIADLMAGHFVGENLNSFIESYRK